VYAEHKNLIIGEIDMKSKMPSGKVRHGGFIRMFPTLIAQDQPTMQYFDFSSIELFSMTLREPIQINPIHKRL
jgi:hypothetical protein